MPSGGAEPRRKTGQILCFGKQDDEDRHLEIGWPRSQSMAQAGRSRRITSSSRHAFDTVTRLQPITPRLEVRSEPNDMQLASGVDGQSGAYWSELLTPPACQFDFGEDEHANSSDDVESSESIRTHDGQI